MTRKTLTRSVAVVLAVLLGASACSANKEIVAGEEATESANSNEQTSEPIEKTAEEEGVVNDEATTGATALEDEVAMEVSSSDTIIEATQAVEGFSVFSEAVVTADLVDTLGAEGEFTVFAPTNEAFEAFLAENELTQENLLADPDLADILTNHILPTRVSSLDILRAAKGEISVDTVTLQGGELALPTDYTDPRIGEANVVIGDIETSNGVIHAIDQVLPLSQR